MKYTNVILTVIAILLLADFIALTGFNPISSAHAAAIPQPVAATEVVIVGIGTRGNYGDGAGAQQFADHKTLVTKSVK